ncbi:toll/interleukin-1 receptor domain-containing protein, partial [Frankia sp. Cj3]|uniref:toll/interleukin-1 receptor domain-containing protein n=1 Tax=Frankia sp. Cj3 TaxID=2880976 RepID=UPI001EF5D5E0
MASAIIRMTGWSPVVPARGREHDAMAHVFVSHATQDLAVAGTVAGWLRHAGHSVFLAEDLRDGIAVGEAWVRRLFDELFRADALLAVVSDAFRRSEWCSAEIGAALATGLRVLPVPTTGDTVSPLIPPEIIQRVVLDSDGGDTARRRLVEALRRIDSPDDAQPGDTSVVYPGLAAFTAAQARMFFGRAAETRQLAERLRAAARQGGGLLPVVGPSGCGKSSLVRAGLVPLLAADDNWLVLGPLVPAAAPAADPSRELVRLLAAEAQRRGLGWSASEIGEAIARPGGITRLVTDLLAAAQARSLLLVIDQAEELLTHSTDDSRRGFAPLLVDAAGGRVRIVATVRSEYLDRLVTLAADTGLPVDQPFLLAPLATRMLPLVISGPAR